MISSSASSHPPRSSQFRNPHSALRISCAKADPYATSVHRRIDAFLIVITIAILVLLVKSSAHAGSGTWLSAPDTSDWVPASGKKNWDNGPSLFPGSTTGTTNGDTATFLTSNITSITLNSAINIKNITFGVSGSEPSSFTVGTTGGNSLLLTSGGFISIPSGTNVGNGHTETINAPLVLEPASSTTAGTYSFSNAATSQNLILSIGGAISGGTTTQGVTLTLTGSNTGPNTISGNISDGTAAAGVSLSKTSTGTWKLTGNNTYTGTTTISGGTLIAAGSSTNQALGGTSSVTINSGGTLMLGASNQIKNTAGVTLNGGTLNLNGFSEGSAGSNGVGALTLQATSTIDFGASSGSVSSVIQFGGITQSVDGSILQIVNWTAAGANADHLYFSGSSSTFTGQFTQAEVSFNGISGYQVTDFGTYFEVSGVPEPSTWAAAALSLAFVGYTQRRRVRKLVPARVRA